jgi:hypothetical protein
MYTLLRIDGERSALEELCREFVSRYGLERASITRRGELTIDLSKERSWDEHQWQVENVLREISPFIGLVRGAGYTPYVDCAVYVPGPSRPEISVVVRRFRHRSSVIEEMARLELDYEITVYVEPPAEPGDE